MQELAWRTRIEGSNGQTEREFNGAVVGLQQTYRDGIAALGTDFADVGGAEQDARLAGAPEFKGLLYQHACEGMYGDPGVRRQPGRSRLEDDRLARRHPTARLHEGRSREPRNSRSAGATVADLDCDAVIVGSGPGGSTFADVLTAAGWSVIVLEKGRNHLISLEPPFDPSGDLSNDEIKFLRRHFLGPDPLIEPRTYRRTAADGDRLFTGEVNSLPTTVGGGGFHADGKLPRFREEDFHLLSARGPIDGATVADWPVEYDELEPHYAIAERLIGTAGDAGKNPFEAWRSGPYPMPPGPDMFGAILTSEAAAKRGLHPYRAPTGVNSIFYDERPPCNNCGFCGHFGCPIHAKGDPISSLRRALRTGRCEVRPESYVKEVVLDSSGKRHGRALSRHRGRQRRARGAGVVRRGGRWCVRDPTAAAALRRGQLV